MRHRAFHLWVALQEQEVLISEEMSVYRVFFSVGQSAEDESATTVLSQQGAGADGRVAALQ
jgi:hypothetical protein